MSEPSCNNVPIFTTTYADNLKCARNKTNGNTAVHICLENLEQEEKSIKKCLQDLNNISGELQKTCSAKLNDSESKTKELQEGYRIAVGVLAGFIGLAIFVIAVILVILAW